MAREYGLSGGRTAWCGPLEHADDRIGFPFGEPQGVEVTNRESSQKEEMTVPKNNTPDDWMFSKWQKQAIADAAQRLNGLVDDEEFQSLLERRVLDGQDKLNQALCSYNDAVKEVNDAHGELQAWLDVIREQLEEHGLNADNLDHVAEQLDAVSPPDEIEEVSLYLPPLEPKE